MVAGFSISVIEQSQQSASAINRLSITIAPYTSMFGQTVTISGLEGGYRETTQVMLRDESGDASCGDISTAATNFSTCHSFFKNDTGDAGVVGQAVWDGTLQSDFGANSTRIVAGNAYSNMQVAGLVRAHTARFVGAGQVIQISFDVKNSAFGQPPPTITILYGNATVSSSPVTMLATSANVQKDALRIAGFDYTCTEQSEAASFVTNTLTFFFSNYAVLSVAKGTRLTISGLISTEETSEQASSRILREVPLVSGKIINVAAQGDSFVLDEDISGFSLGYQLMIRSDKRLITGWNAATKTVSVASALSFLPANEEAYSISMDFYKSFGNVGAWNRSSGALVLDVFYDTVAQKRYGFSFEIKNPLIARDPVPVYITTSGIYSPSFLMVSGPGRMAPLLIIGLTTKKIGQSTFAPNTLNTLTITFATTDSIYASRNAAVHIYGLTGTQTSNVSVTVRGRDAVSVAMFRPLADWAQSTGHLTIWLAGTTIGYELYTLSFDLLNPFVGQESPAVSIEVTPYPLIHLTALDKGPKNHAPLLVFKYTYAPKIGQSTSSGSNWARGFADQINTISVTISTNVYLSVAPRYGDLAESPNCSYSVSGLLPTIAGSGTLTHVTSAVNVALDLRADTRDNFYVGYALRVRSQFVEIQAYVGVSQTVSLKALLTFSAVAFVDVYILYATQALVVALGGDRAYMGASGSYHSLNGSLLGDVIQETSPAVDYIFSFDVKNPPEGRFGTTAVSIVLCSMPMTKMDTGLENLQPGVVAGHVVPPFLFQDNPGSAAVNRLTIRLNLFTTLEPGNVVTIHGLQSMQLLNGNSSGLVVVDDASSKFPTACPAPTYSCGVLFGAVPNWNISNNSLSGAGWWDGSLLRLYVRARAQASTSLRLGQISISFQVVNPVLLQPSPVIEVEMSGKNNFSPRTVFQKGTGNQAPLLIGGFQTQVIFQQTPSSNALNIVTIILNSLIDLTGSNYIEIARFRIPGPNPSPNYHDISITHVVESSLGDAQQDALRVFGATLRSTPNNETLRLTFASGKTMYANQNYTVTFSMQNQREKHLSPTISIQIGQIGGDPLSSSQIMSKLETMSHPLLVAGFERKTIQQSDPSTSALNTLTVTVRASANLPNQTYIIIEGLTNTQTPDMEALPILGSFNSIFGEFALWRQKSGTLTLQLVAQLSLAVTYSFQVQLRNPQRATAAAPDVYIWADSNESAAVDVARVLMTPTNGTYRALNIVDVLFVAIQQTSVSAGELNNLTLSLNPGVDLVAPFQIVTLFGLTGSSTPSGRIEIDSFFASFGNFTQEGTLTFKLDQTAPSKANHTFGFTLRNALEGQMAPTISMQLGRTVDNYVSWTASKRLVTVPADIHLQPLQIAYFVTKRIGQNNFRGSQLNRLSVLLVPRVNLGTDAAKGPYSITLSGLENAFFPTGPIDLLVSTEDTTACASNCTTYFSDSPGGTPGQGYWQGNEVGSESIVLFLVRPLVALQAYAFAFEITNPAAGQVSPEVSIQSSGYNSRITRVAVDKPGADFDPLVVAGFRVARIGQSTPSHGRINRLFVTLIPHTHLAQGITLTLSNLKGVSHPSGALTLSSFTPPSSASCGIHPYNLTACPLYFEAPVFSGTVGEALWNNLDKTLSMRIAAPIATQSVVEVAWDVRNGWVGQSAQEIEVSGRGDNVTLLPQRMEHATGNNAPLLIARFETRLIQQTVSQASVRNLVTIVLGFNVFFANASLTVSGLVQTKTPDQALPLGFGSFNTSQAVGSTGAWSKATGTLLLRVVQMEAGTNYTINFTLTNPDGGQRSPLIYLEIVSQYLDLSATLMEYTSPAVAPLFVFGLSERAIRQTSEFPGALNTIIVMVASSVAQEAPTQFTIKGLVLTETASGVISVSDLNNTGVFNVSACAWDKDQGSLVLEIQGQLAAGVIYTLSFQVPRLLLTYTDLYGFREQWAIQHLIPYTVAENRHHTCRANQAHL